MVSTLEKYKTTDSISITAITKAATSVVTTTLAVANL